MVRRRLKVVDCRFRVVGCHLGLGFEGRYRVVGGGIHGLCKGPFGNSSPVTALD